MERNKKLAEWMGWKLHYYDWDEEKQFPYFILSGKPWRTHKIDACPLPNFSFLNVIFKHLIPEVDKRYGYAVVQNILLKWICALQDYDKAAEDLCQIIESLIDKEAK